MSLCQISNFSLETKSVTADTCIICWLFILEALVWFILFISDGFHLVRVFGFNLYCFSLNCAEKDFIVDSDFRFSLCTYQNLFLMVIFRKNEN